jgi:hypothetical protein
MPTRSGRWALSATPRQLATDIAGLQGAGLDADSIDWPRGTGRVGGPVQLAGATPVLGESTYAAYLGAATWLTGDVPD